MAIVDPRLDKAIKSRSGAHPRGTVQATVTLRSVDPSKPLDAAQTTRSVNQIIEKVARQTRKQPRDLMIHPYIQSFSIDADAEMVGRILSEDSVETASFDGESE
jgi:hypothetical protein